MISVVVLNKNRLPYLALKIQSLLYQINRSDLDILVVDYSDTDEVAEYCLKWKIRCVRVKENLIFLRQGT
jgi:glycosyltransferase involved in cell wall biosynthesis